MSNLENPISAFQYCPWDGHPFGTMDIVCSKCGKLRQSSMPDDGDPLTMLFPHSYSYFSSSSSSSLSSSFSSSSDPPPPSSSPSADGGPSPSPPPLRPLPRWRKILYEQQGYADNHVDPSFLAGLRRNLHLRRYTFAGLVRDSLILAQQLSLAALFLAVFDLLSCGRLSPASLLPLHLAALLAACLPLWPDFRARLWGGLRALALLTALLAAASPLLRSLTDPISDDTIWAFAISLLLVHLACHEYRPFLAAQRFFSPISLNAAVLASVVLASRLKDLLCVFAFLFCSFSIFIAAPLVRHHLHVRLARSVWPSLLLFALSSSVVWVSSPFYALLYLLVLCFVTLVLSLIHI